MEMLTLYDPMSNAISSMHRYRFDAPVLRYYASDIMQQLGCDTPGEISGALNRAMKACAVIGISIEDNFKPVNRYDGERLMADWKLSSLACYLLVVNGDPCNPAVARAQLLALMRS
jgi:hypothetical protein